MTTTTEEVSFDTLDREAKARIAAGTGSWSPTKMTHQHMALVDLMLLNPTMNQKELAKHLGRGHHWVNRVVNCDSFKALMAERREELIGDDMRKKINGQMQRLVIQSVETVSRKLTAADSAEVAMEALGVASKALGLAK